MEILRIVLIANIAGFILAIGFTTYLLIKYLKCQKELAKYKEKEARQNGNSRH